MKLKITIGGVAYDVDVEVLDAGDGFLTAGPLPAVQPAARVASAAPPAGLLPAAPASPESSAPPPEGAGCVTSPIAGVVLELHCGAGEQVTQGQKLVVIEAMKMKTNVTAPLAGRIKEVEVEVGDSVREGQPLVELS